MTETIKYWTTKNGDKMLITEMTTSHLTNLKNMIEHGLDNRVYEFSDVFDKYYGHIYFDGGYYEDVLNAVDDELENRLETQNT